MIKITPTPKNPKIEKVLKNSSEVMDFSKYMKEAIQTSLANSHKAYTSAAKVILTK